MAAFYKLCLAGRRGLQAAVTLRLHKEDDYEDDDVDDQG